jgi:hypothetical protein
VSGCVVLFAANRCGESLVRSKLLSGSCALIARQKQQQMINRIPFLM